MKCSFCGTEKKDGVKMLEGEHGGVICFRCITAKHKELHQELKDIVEEKEPA